ncbi:glycine cleavage system protein H [Paracoccus marinaquae]|uniref:Glycine cleavage system protein H n=1 Tax=Paracoccus marinaquae TaxID=2841926 RepID=A0ABS6AFS5_9RHOB|nr:glycine cleavage system protein H [Paracoccus marinaquae]MBU3029446.1 glycine cleavage system protein H [Paracoccus marinaquae]
MAIVRGCAFPDGLWYDLPHHVWYRDEGDAGLRAGITPVGVCLAREVLIFTPRRIGFAFSAGRALATIESAKWVGTVKAGFDGTICGLNEALQPRAAAVNDDCYGAGWMFLLQPARADWAADLVPGARIGAAYEAWMESMGFDGCG